VTLARVSAGLAPAAFALLAAVLAALGAVPTVEAGWAAVAVALGFVPTGWLAPAGWRRRAAELSLLAPALALTLIADPTMRRMALPPLLAAAGWAATAAALPRAGRRDAALISAGLALAVRSAGGLGLSGHQAGEVVLAVVAPALAAWALSRAVGPAPALSLFLGALPLERSPLAAVGLLVAGVLLARIGKPLPLAGRALRGVAPALPAAALVLATLSPWGGLAPARALPGAGWPALAAAVAAAAAAVWLPPAAGGAAWLAATLAFGPLQPPPPDRPGVELTSAAPTADLPAAESGTYVVDLALANGASVLAGRPIARAGEVTLRAGVDAAEWAHERADVVPTVAHPLPARPVWRPSGLGADALWGVSGRSIYTLDAGVAPRITREPTLPPEVVVSVVSAGPARPTPPRSWPLPAWLLAAALAVALLEIVSGTWRSPWSALPWVPIIAGSLVARMPVEPLRLLVERHAVDLALAALLAAWLPAARAWLARGRVFAAAAALLVPLAVATPRLTPSLYGDEPFHLIVLDSLAHDHDLDLSNNYDLERHPYNRIYITTAFLHSPALAVLLLPGYLLAGRTGALLLLALAGAGVVALVARRCRQLGCPTGRVRLLVVLLLLTYPLATFSSQIWVEVPAALAVAACLVLLAATPARRAAVTTLAALGVVVKTRLGLILLPLAAVAWWPRRARWRELRTGLAVVGAVAALGIATSLLTTGRPFGYRTPASLVPRSWTQPVRVVGGLLFDPSGGLAFAAPLALVALAGVPALWRRGGAGERAVLAGGAATVVALLHSHEWYGGGAPPARYLVPLLPAFALASAQVLTRPKRWRSLARLLVPPSLVVAWVLVSRPHVSVNPGDGGWWLADAVARRFAVDARDLVPSFLVVRPASFLVPAALVIAAAALVLLARRAPVAARTIARCSIALALTTASAALVTLHRRSDRVVEVEAPQVQHLGGLPEPPEGTFSRFTYPGGWRLAAGDRVVVPIDVPPGAGVVLEGWLEGGAPAGATLEVSWDGGVPACVPVAGTGRGRVALPPGPSGQRRRLGVALATPAAGSVVLDRVVVVTP
jgi:hypothetical protein